VQSTNQPSNVPLLPSAAINGGTIQGGDEDGEGGGSDITALLGNLGPLIGGLSGVSTYC
jgi:hypothetical protein